MVFLDNLVLPEHKSKIQPIQVENPTAVKVVGIENGKIICYKDKLLEIFANECIQDLPVALFSVTGLKRVGKSFLLNNFLRYFNGSHQQAEDWSKVKLENYFAWGGGTEVVTDGIYIWNQPFVLDNKGKKMVLYLMDSVGTNDLSTDKEIWNKIFTFGTMVSSMQVYNVKDSIDLRNINELEFFSSFADEHMKCLQETSTNETPVEKMFGGLRILIRDWVNYKDCAYGDDKTFMCMEKNMTPECSKTFALIKHLFSDSSAFLLPHPGLRIARGDFEYHMELNDDEKVFFDYLNQFYTLIFTTIKPKSWNGRSVTCSEFGSFFVKCFEQVLKCRPSEAREEIIEEELKEKMLIEFWQKMNADYEEEKLTSEQEVKEKFETSKTEVLQQFTNERRLFQTSEKAQKKYKKILEKEITVYGQQVEERYSAYRLKCLLLVEKLVLIEKQKLENELIEMCHSGSLPLPNFEENIEQKKNSHLTNLRCELETHKQTLTDFHVNKALCDFEKETSDFFKNSSKINENNKENLDINKENRKALRQYAIAISKTYTPSMDSMEWGRFDQHHKESKASAEFESAADAAVSGAFDLNKYIATTQRCLKKRDERNKKFVEDSSKVAILCAVQKYLYWLEKTQMVNRQQTSSSELYADLNKCNEEAWTEFDSVITYGNADFQKKTEGSMEKNLKEESIRFSSQKYSKISTKAVAIGVGVGLTALAIGLTGGLAAGLVPLMAVGIGEALFIGGGVGAAAGGVSGALSGVFTQNIDDIKNYVPVKRPQLVDNIKYSRPDAIGAAKV